MIPLPEPEVGYQTWTGQCRGAYTADQMHAHAAAARRQALEEARDACERISEGYWLRESNQWPEMKTDAQTGASDCEAAIRSLIDKDTA